MSPRQSVEELEAKVGDTPLGLVYIASNVEDARRAEQSLDDQSIEFAVSVEPYTQSFGLTLGAQYQGVFFYVPLSQHDSARRILNEAGLHDTIELDGE